MTVEHKSLRDEVLFILGRATAPLDGGEIYERATLADEMKQVSNAIFQLKAAKKIERVEGDGRARYVLAKGTATPAPAGKAGRPAADPGLSLDGAAGSARRAPDAPITGIRPAAESDPDPLPVVDIPILGESGSVAPFVLQIAEEKADGTMVLRGMDVDASAARLADAMLARSREQLSAPMPIVPMPQPRWWIDQDGDLEILAAENEDTVVLSREQAQRLALMVIAAHDVLEAS
ncbi:MAG: hypothetical protein M0Z99_22450 [Betaproteobacteria bacterium]|nr:hypothetical protein [Betaproteobacteria bacterium]